MNQSECLIVIPCYNEAARINLEAFRSFRSESKKSIDFLFVNDGSKDQTLRILTEFCSKEKHFRVLDLGENCGKAEAIRRAMSGAVIEQYRYMGFFDADLATPLIEIENLLKHAEISDKDFVLGSRVQLLGYSEINRKPTRHYIGRVFATLVSNMLKIPIYDTQCGAKLFRSSLVPDLFRQPFVSKWLFDVELLFRFKHLDEHFEQKIIEVPLKKWLDVPGSKISFFYFLKAPFDLLKIYSHYYSRKRYLANR